MTETTPEMRWNTRPDSLRVEADVERIAGHGAQAALLDACASAWEADLAMRGDGLCLVHGIYSVDEDNPDGDCKVCHLLARIEALEEERVVCLIAEDYRDAERIAGVLATEYTTLWIAKERNGRWVVLCQGPVATLAKEKP